MQNSLASREEVALEFLLLSSCLLQFLPMVVPGQFITCIINNINVIMRFSLILTWFFGITDREVSREWVYILPISARLIITKPTWQKASSILSIHLHWGWKCMFYFHGLLWMWISKISHLEFILRTCEINEYFLRGWLMTTIYLRNLLFYFALTCGCKCFNLARKQSIDKKLFSPPYSAYNDVKKCVPHFPERQQWACWLLFSDSKKQDDKLNK